jgi:hypothetical protein
MQPRDRRSWEELAALPMGLSPIEFIERPLRESLVRVEVLREGCELAL